MARQKMYFKWDMPTSIVEIVKAICADYDRRERAIKFGNVAGDVLMKYVELNNVINNALQAVEVGIRTELLRDIQNRRGYEHSAAALIIAKNTYYVFHEIYESDLIISDAADRVKAAERIEMSDGNKKSWYLPRVRLAPPDLWNRSQESGKSRALMFYESGLELTQSNNDRHAGWLSIKELLKIRTTADGQKITRLKIFRTCPNLIRTLQQILIDEKDVEDCAKEPHELTHAPDALRYFAIYWTRPPETNAKKKKVKYRADLLEDYFNASDEERQAIIKKYGEPEL